MTTSAEGKSICCHALVLILELINVTTLDRAPSAYFAVG